MYMYIPCTFMNMYIPCAYMFMTVCKLVNMYSCPGGQDSRWTPQPPITPSMIPLQAASSK